MGGTRETVGGTVCSKRTSKRYTTRRKPQKTSTQTARLAHAHHHVAPLRGAQLRRRQEGGRGGGGEVRRGGEGAVGALPAISWTTWGIGRKGTPVGVHVWTTRLMGATPIAGSSRPRIACVRWGGGGGGGNGADGGGCSGSPCERWCWLEGNKGACT